MTTAGLHFVNELDSEPAPVLKPGISIPVPCPASTTRRQGDGEQDQERMMHTELKHGGNLNSASAADTSNSIRRQV